jgi:hypothetical protein
VPDRDYSAASVRDASNKWGCAWQRCLRKARFVVTGADGSEWGACGKHIKEVRRVAAE